jgi:hypothetical protein
VSYKRVFAIELRDMRLIYEAHTLFLTGQACEGVRFLTRHKSFVAPKQLSL